MFCPCPGARKFVAEACRDAQQALREGCSPSDLTGVVTDALASPAERSVWAVETVAALQRLGMWQGLQQEVGGKMNWGLHFDQGAGTCVRSPLGQASLCSGPAQQQWPTGRTPTHWHKQGTLRLAQHMAGDDASVTSCGW